MQQEVYNIVVAEVKSRFIPDNPEGFVKDLEKQTGVNCTVQHRDDIPVYHLRGSLSSIQKAASFLEKLYETRSDVKNDSEALGGRLSSNRHRCKPVSGCDEGSSARNPVDSGARVLSTSSQRQPFRDESPERDPLEIGNVADYGRSQLGMQETDFSGHLKGSRVIEDVRKSPEDVRYTSYEPSRYSQGLDTSLRQVDLNLTFKTPITRHQVSIYNGDLTKVKVDAVVCSTNPYLTHSGGVAKAIAEVGGDKVKEAADRHIQTHGPLYPSNVTFIRGGKLPSKYVIYAVGPDWKDYKNETECLTTLKETFINCFWCATKELSLTHLALPLISSGISGGPIDKCSHALYKALMEFDRSDVTRPLDIHVVDTNTESVMYLQTHFSAYLKSDYIPFDKKDASSPSRLDSGVNSSERNGYTPRNYADPLNRKPESSPPVVKDFPSENSKKTMDRYSHRNESSSIRSLLNPENSHDMNLPVKYEEENGRRELTAYREFSRSSLYDEDPERPLSRYHSTEESIDLLSGRSRGSSTLSFKTPIGNHQISVYNGDLTKIKADAIVNAANQYLAHVGGVAKAIAKVGGYEVVRESEEYIQRWGPLFPSQVVHTSGGRLPSKYVIHAVGPVWKDYRKEADCLNTLKETFIKCLHHASKGLKVKHIALPLISSGIFGVPLDKCVKALYKALMEFDSQLSHRLDIDIVDTNSESVMYLQTRFCELMKLDNIPFDRKDGKPSHYQRSTVYSRDINGGGSYGVPSCSDTYISTIDTKEPAMKYLRSQASKTSNLYSSRERDSSSKKPSENSLLDKTNKKDKDYQMKYTGKSSGKNIPSEFRVKENHKLSPTNGPMRANHSSSEEALMKKLLDDHEKKGFPTSEFRKMQLMFDKLLKKDESVSSTKERRSRSLDRLPSKKQDSEKSVSGERQSRRDSSKTGNKSFGLTNRRSQSLDRRQKQNDSDKSKTRDLDNMNLARQPRFEKRENPRQSLDRIPQKNEKERTEVGRAKEMSSQHKSHANRCSLCHGEENLRKRSDCVHMICKRCRTMKLKIMCTYCESADTTKGRKRVPAFTEVKKDIKLSPRFDSPVDSSTVSGLARRRRRERQNLNESMQHEPTQRNNKTLSRPQTGESPVIGNESPLKKNNIEDHVTPQPSSVAGGCPICLSGFQDPDCQDVVALNNCGHTFCRECIKHAFETKPACPICGIIYGCYVGNQPAGTMDIEIKPLPYSLPGHQTAGTIIIRYIIPSGIQNESHPHPGSEYTGTSRTAYLPDTDEGRDICRLLKKAFDAKLTFTIGRSVTTGRNDTVTWNDIHHKTHRSGGPSQFGYPDESYLKRVRDELAAKGIQ